MNIDTEKLKVPISEDTSLRDSELHTLRERGFVQAGTAIAQWLILVNETWHVMKLPENEPVRDYLVYLLDRFIRRVDVFDILLGYTYYVQMLSLEKIEKRSAQDLADISLLHVSLFPGRVAERHYPSTVSKSVEIGISTFDLLHRNSHSNDYWAPLYEAMAKSFMQAVIVLRGIYPEGYLEETKLRRLYGGAVRFPSDQDAQVIKSQAERFEQMYLQKGIRSAD